MCRIPIGLRPRTADRRGIAPSMGWWAVPNATTCARRSARAFGESECSIVLLCEGQLITQSVRLDRDADSTSLWSTRCNDALGSLASVHFAPACGLAAGFHPGLASARPRSTAKSGRAASHRRPHVHPGAQGPRNMKGRRARPGGGASAQDPTPSSRKDERSVTAWSLWRPSSAPGPCTRPRAGFRVWPARTSSRFP